MRTSWLACLAALLLAGCMSPIATTRLNAPPHAMTPVPERAVSVFATGAPLRPHVDVAMISVQTSLLAGTQTEIISDMRARAAALGCDAVVILNALGRNRVEGVVGTCIVYTDTAPGAVGVR